MPVRVTTRIPVSSSSSFDQQQQRSVYAHTPLAHLHSSGPLQRAAALGLGVGPGPGHSSGDEDPSHHQSPPPQPQSRSRGSFSGASGVGAIDPTLLSSGGGARITRRLPDPSSSSSHAIAMPHTQYVNDTSVPSSSLSALTNMGSMVQMEELGSPSDVSQSLLHTPPAHRAMHPGVGPGSSGKQWKVFEQGMRFGIMLSLLAWVMWDCIVDARLRPAEQDLWLQLVLPVYRGLGCVVLLGWCWGCSLYIWERYHINYAWLFDLDNSGARLPGSAPASGTLMPYTQVLDECCNVTIVYLANFLLYFKIMRGDFPNWLSSGCLPVIFVVYILVKIFPWSAWLGCATGPGASRNAPLWAALVQVPLAPFGRVTFLTGLIGDVMTSFVKVSVDLAYTICFILGADWMVEIDTLAARADALMRASPGGSPLEPGKVETCFSSQFFKRAIIPLLSALPLWFRFMQCLRRYLNTRKRWPHIGNACKYALSHSVVLFGVYNSSFQHAPATDTYKAAWIIFMVLSTIYTFFWDVYMDWGLGRWKHAFLREELMYPNRGVYYAAIVVDLFMRFAWTLTLIPQGDDSPFPPDFLLYLQPMLAAGEILRRTMWGCFRLEYEHICTQSFHRVPEAPTPAVSLPEMSGYKVIVEVAVLVVMVLSVGTTAALTAN